MAWREIENGAVVRRGHTILPVLIECHREIAVSVGVSAVERQAPLERGDPLGPLPATHEHHPEVVPRERVRPVERKRAIQQCLGLIERARGHRLACPLPQLKRPQTLTTSSPVRGSSRMIGKPIEARGMGARRLMEVSAS